MKDFKFEDILHLRAIQVYLEANEQLITTYHKRLNHHKTFHAIALGASVRIIKRFNEAFTGFTETSSSENLRILGAGLMSLYKDICNNVTAEEKLSINEGIEAALNDVLNDCASDEVGTFCLSFSSPYSESDFSEDFFTRIEPNL